MNDQEASKQKESDGNIRRIIGDVLVAVGLVIVACACGGPLAGLGAVVAITGYDLKHYFKDL